ncbi:SufD family Fe-S cluster assembly protein [Candidatus Dependentiae bacterium]
MTKIKLIFIKTPKTTISLAEQLLKKRIDANQVEELFLEIHVKENVQCTVKDDLLSLGIHSCSIKAEIEKNASLNLQASFLCPILAPGCKKRCCALPAHSKITREIDCTLSKDGASANTKIRFAGGKKRILDLKILKNHIGQATQSSTCVKSVLDKEAQIKCLTHGHVASSAKGSKVNQSNKNLILSKKTNIFSVPSLCSKTDDVECSHSSTASCIDENIMFYLESRGISKTVAKEILVGAYLK